MICGCVEDFESQPRDGHCDEVVALVAAETSDGGQCEASDHLVLLRVVAVLAGGDEVAQLAGPTPCPRYEVVDGGRVGCAAGESELADVVVAVEDLPPYPAPVPPIPPVGGRYPPVPVPVVPTPGTRPVSVALPAEGGLPAVGAGAWGA